MRLKSLKLINFKKFIEETDLEFQDHNLIMGQNGAGKSAIKDAITFCLYNRTDDGSLSNSTRYITNGKMKCLVELAFENNGKEHTVRRERTEKQTRITYRDNSQSEEDSQITQETLESFIPTYQNFSAVFNIGWFMGLNDREKRDYILGLTPQIDRSQIYEKLGGKEEDIQRFGLSFSDLERTHKNLLNRKLENEKQIEAMKIFNSESTPVEIPKLQHEDKSEELAKLEKEKEEAIHLEYEQKEYERIKSHNEESEKKNKELEERIAKIKTLELELPNQEKLNSLIAKKNEHAKEISLPAGTCPTCLQTISTSHRNRIAKTILENRAKLAKVENQILEEKNLNDKLTKEWKDNEEQKKIKLMLETQFTDPLPLSEKPKEISQLDITELEKLKEEQEKYLEQKNTIEVLTKQEKIRLEKIEQNKVKMASLSQENDSLKPLIHIFSPKGIPAEEMNMKLEPLKEKFRELLPNSDIITLESLKNEMGYKEVFHITVDGKDYAKLSLGEKMRVDISLSQIINSMLPEKINMFFLDNSEVLDSSISLPIQSFICKVTNQPLKIN